MYYAVTQGTRHVPGSKKRNYSSDVSARESARNSIVKVNVIKNVFLTNFYKRSINNALFYRINKKIISIIFFFWEGGFTNF